MATVVLVHGIAQEQLSADSLETGGTGWLPALTGGVRSAGHAGLADRLSQRVAPSVDVRMAYYGDLFLDPSAQGAGVDLNTLDDEESIYFEELARVWLDSAASYADDPRDRATAAQELDLMHNRPSDAQGARAAVRPAMNALGRLRWFAPLGMGVAGRFVYRALSQVSRYINDDNIRMVAQQRVLDLIDTDTRLVIAHSLGTVVAYEALHNNDHPTALITLGSPLALRSIIYDRLRPQPSCVPASVTQWDNFADVDDLVAAHTDLTSFFPPQPPSTVRPISGPELDNGSAPHDAIHYLNKQSVGRAVARALSQRR